MALLTCEMWVLTRAQEAGLGAIVNICTTPEEIGKGLKLATTYPWIYNVASTTPHDAPKQGETHFAEIAHYARSGDLVAVGETGLDYYYHPDSAPIQQSFLRRYLQLALECRLPIVIHCRDAFTDFFRILDETYKVKDNWAPGVLHCFTGTLEEAQEVIKRNWYLSLSGIVTFKKSIALQAVAKDIPLDQLLIETDAPYLAPHPYRGKRNEPAYLVETAKFIAQLRGLSFEEVANTTLQNARTLFRLNS